MIALRLPLLCALALTLAACEGAFPIPRFVDGGIVLADGGGAAMPADGGGNSSDGGAGALDGGVGASLDGGAGPDGGGDVLDGGVTSDGGGVDDGGVAQDGGGQDGGGTSPVSCGSTAPPGPEGWEVVCGDINAGHLLGVWGSADDDVYFVGGRGSTTTILHWDGRELVKMDNPGRARAWWVFGTDADHVYVVGERGLGLRRIGRGAWEPFETGTRQIIYGLWGTSPDDLFYVSGDLNAATPEPHVFRWTPAGPVDQSVPGTSTRAFFKVWGTSASNVFACGESGVILRYDGAAWRSMTTPGSATLLTLAGTGPNDVYAVGGPSEGALWRFDGNAWSSLQMPVGTPGLMGVWTGGDGTVWVSGASGFVGRRTSAEITAETRPSADDIHAVFGTSSHVWAVGGNLFSPDTPHGVVLRRTREVERPCPPGGIQSPGFHHLDLQGREGAPNADGTYPMFLAQRGVIDARLRHGEHYLLNRGAFAEFTAPLCADITNRVSLRMPNNDETGAVAIHQLFVVHNGVEALIAQATDSDPGNSGYNPFVRSNFPASELDAIAFTDTSGRGTGAREWTDMRTAPNFETAPSDILARKGDTLLLRTTNLSEHMYSIMVWFPQNGLEYQSFIEVEVPATAGGTPPASTLPPPDPGPCATPSATQYVELGRGGGSTFLSFGNPATAPVVVGPQGSLMFLLSARGRGFSGGNPSNALDPTNPWLFVTLALEASDGGVGAVVADVRGRPGWSSAGDTLVLADYKPTVPGNTYALSAIANKMILARATLVDRSGLTLCQETRFRAVSQ